MKNKKLKVIWSRSMIVPTVIMGILAIVLVIAGYVKGQQQHLIGMKTGMNLIIQIFPLLFFAFVVAGMVQVLIPQDAISKWIGSESGMKGIILGSVAGAIAPGGPYVSMPVAAGLLKSGASIGTMVAFLTGWSIWAVNRLPLEIGIMGWKFTFIRLASTFIFPPLAGGIAQFVFGSIKNI
jgi:uncharacterized membrane protein YraQ (UPF0718 family)